MTGEEDDDNGGHEGNHGGVASVTSAAGVMKCGHSEIDVADKQKLKKLTEYKNNDFFL